MTLSFDEENDTSILDGKTVVFGHSPTKKVQYSVWETMRIAHGEGVIDIDCGCGHPRLGGQLACLRLEDMTEFYSKEGVVSAQEAIEWKRRYCG